MMNEPLKSMDAQQREAWLVELASKHGATCSNAPDDRKILALYDSELVAFVDAVLGDREGYKRAWEEIVHVLGLSGGLPGCSNAQFHASVVMPKAYEVTALAKHFTSDENAADAVRICRELAKLREGLDNSNSSAEEYAARLAAKAQRLFPEPIPNEELEEVDDILAEMGSRAQIETMVHPTALAGYRRRLLLAMERNAPAQPQGEAKAGADDSELDRLRSVIERDRTAFCGLIVRLKREVESHQHLGDDNARAAAGYEYDEPGFVREFGQAYTTIMRELERAHQRFRDYSDCPKDAGAVRAAQAAAQDMIDKEPAPVGGGVDADSVSAGFAEGLAVGRAQSEYLCGLLNDPKCERCGARNPLEAETLCKPSDDSCPGVEWPLQRIWELAAPAPAGEAVAYTVLHTSTWQPPNYYRIEIQTNHPPKPGDKLYTSPHAGGGDQGPSWSDYWVARGRFDVSHDFEEYQRACEWMTARRFAMVGRASAGSETTAVFDVALEASILNAQPYAIPENDSTRVWQLFKDEENAPKHLTTIAGLIISGISRKGGA